MFTITRKIQLLYLESKHFTGCTIAQSVQQLGYGLDGWGIGVRFPAWVREICFPLSWLALGPTQPSVQCLTGALKPGMKRSGRETDSLSTNAEVKNECGINNYRIRLHGIMRNSAQRQFYLRYFNNYLGYQFRRMRWVEHVACLDDNTRMSFKTWRGQLWEPGHEMCKIDSPGAV